MHIHPTLATTLGASASAAFGLLGRIAQAAAPPLALPTQAVAPDRVRDALLGMGVAAADADIALAEALARAGLPLTAASLAEAHADLAHAPGASALSYVLAKSLALPTSPATLRALSAVLDAPGGPSRGALPEQVRMWLGLGVEAATGPEAQARHLREMMLLVGRSTENRVLAVINGKESLPVADLRTALLRLAVSSGDPALRAEADGLASLLEGQQLLNQASLTAHAGRPQLPLYFALPLTFDGLPTVAEMRAWSPERQADIADDDAAILRVTVRLTPPRLGRVQADLTGHADGRLICRLGAEKTSAARLLLRHSDALAGALGSAGWPSCEVSCRPQSQWPPLWPGGETFTTPRACVDRHV